ncbi:hypothetical protein ABVT39_027571, partial [Epinephelus coioides]
MSYLDLVEIMLALIRASREGNWILHLAAIRQMIPWCFAYDKVNYARFLPFYYASMTQLPVEHPEVYTQFMEGRFAVQIGTHNPFGHIPVDQTIEETVSRDTQTPGGTKGFSLKKRAVTKYYLTSEYRSRYPRQLRDMTGENDSNFAHPDIQLPRIRKDEVDVQSLVQLMESSWINPFSPDYEELVSLSTGMAAPPDVANDLIGAPKIGEDAYEDFKQKRMETDSPDTKFHDRIPEKKLKTFTDLSKKSHTLCKRKEVILKADRKVFGQMILAAESRQLHMGEVLAHPLGPLPWALANSDGSLQSILVQVIHEGGQSQRIDVIFDVYRKMSIKDLERAKRGTDPGIQLRSIAPGHKIYQWKKLLCSSTNKTHLIWFLLEEWKGHLDKINEKVLYVTREDACFKLTRQRWEEVPELSSTQEEADTRLLLHALHVAESGYEGIIVTADDTDVMVICIGI